MRRSHFDAFAPVCPVCARQGRAGRRLVLAVQCSASTGDVQAGILHCPEPLCRHEYPIIDGVPVIVPDIARLMAERGVELLVRCDLDPALESLLGDAIGPDSWFDAMRQTQSTYGWDAFAELDPDEPPGEAAEEARPGAARRCLARLLAMAPPHPDPTGRIVDLGCAAGRTSFELAGRHPEALVLGIDTNLGLLRMAAGAASGQVSYPRRRIGLVYDRRRFAVALPGADRVDFWAADALALPLPPCCADMVAGLNLLDCVSDPAGVLAAMAALLSPGGRLLLACPYDWSTRATPPIAWIGGHSQRADHAGAAEAFLRRLLVGDHPRAVHGLHLLAEDAAWPWHTRLHARSLLLYSTHLLALARCDA